MGRRAPDDRPRLLGRGTARADRQPAGLTLSRRPSRPSSLRIRVLCVGKPRDRLLVSLHERYAERITRLGAGYETAWVAEERQTRRYTADHIREREARSLAGGWPSQGTVVVLDPAGRMLSSEELAARLARWARPEVTFVVGGPLGLDRQIVERADARWSLTALTFPHEMVRCLVAAQIYRALCLSRGIPYHK